MDVKQQAIKELARRELMRRQGGAAQAQSQQSNEMPWYAEAAQAADDIARLGASGMTFGFADKVAAGAKSGYIPAEIFNVLPAGLARYAAQKAGVINDDERGLWGDYNQKLAAERAATEAARQRAGYAGLVADLGGSVLTGSGLAKAGLTLAGRGGTAAMQGIKGLVARTGLMGLEGAGYGALSAVGNDTDIGNGALLGLAGGMGGNLLGEGIAKGAEKFSRALAIARATPEQRAAGQIYEAAQNVGRDEALKRLNDLGPDAMAIDALGKRGTALGRGAANLSPDARETLETALLARKAAQNPRMVADIERVAGLPVGNRVGVKQMQDDVYNKAAPAINRAYEEAKMLGFDMDPSKFDDILQSPTGQRAWKQSLNAVRDRAAVNPMKSPIGETPSSIPAEKAIKSARSKLMRENRIINKNAPMPKDANKSGIRLSEFLAKRGGVKDYKGELIKGLDAGGYKFKGKPLVTENGVDLDYAREAAAEAGYFNHLYGNADDAMANSTVSDLLDVLDNDLRGSPAYAAEDIAHMEYVDAMNQARDMFRANMDQVSAEGIDHVSDDVVERAVDILSNDEVSPYEALQKAIYDDIAENGIPQREVKPGMFDKAKVRDFSNLARLDETKRLLDDRARSSFRAGNNAQGSAAADLAKALRTRMDDALQGQEYAKARALRQDVYQTQDALDMGAQLARPNVPMNLPSQAAGIPKKDALRQGYGAAMSERLLNKMGTEGALNALSTPMAKEAALAALGKEGADELGQALLRERLFNSVARDVTGNSTTARQVAEMLGTGSGVGGAAMMMGADAATTGLAATIGGLTRRGASSLARKFATDAQLATAPHIAEILTRRSIPQSRPIPAGALEKLSKAEREALSRALMLMSVSRSTGTGNQ